MCKFLLILSSLLAASACPAAEPAYEPTTNYTAQKIEGWTVYVNNRLLNEKKELCEKALELLRVRLVQTNLALPKRALERLREVRFWVEAESKQVACMCYHPSREWLKAHGINPEKAKSIEIGTPANFLAWSQIQPSMVIHELSHAYHHQVLGYDQPDIKAAYPRAVESKSYESVLFYDGRKRRAYALNNDQEYFAELSEAYFGTNDFYPFVRPEIKEHDPVMFEILKKLWEPPEPVTK
jgi:hypothetical protein